MSSFVWMRFLESAPERYDKGIGILSRGRIAGVYEAIADRAAAPGKRVLDVGCGTGGVSLACAARGARVVGIDASAQMLEVARAKPVPRASGGTVEWLELGMAEIEDRYPRASFDAVACCLVFSELSAEEQAYALGIARSRLVPGGRLVIADETLPAHAWPRARHRVWRAALQVLTYLWVQTTTRPVEHLADRVRAAGFTGVEEERLWGDTFFILEAVRDGARA